MNGHGGNAPLHDLASRWMADHPGARVRVHDWWKAPRTWAKVREVDPEASHASWMESFPWTRVAGATTPEGRKPMIDPAQWRALAPEAVREVLGDGSFGGLYRRPDEELAALWAVAIEETRALLEQIRSGLARQATSERRAAFARELRQKYPVEVLLEPYRVPVELGEAPTRGNPKAPVTVV